MPKTNYKDQIDPELWGSIRNFPYNMALVSMGNVYQEAAYQKTEVPEGIVQKTIEISGTQGLTFPVDMFEPAGREEPAPALIYAHGGAFSYKPDVYHKKLVCIYAAKAGCKVLFAHYHLLPKYPYPAAYEDVLALYRYALEHSLLRYGPQDTFQVSYVGNIYWGGLSEYMQEIYAITQGHLMLEVNATTDKFCISFQTLTKAETYLEAFLKVLEEEGIPYEVGEKESSNLPGIQFV